MGFLLTFGRRQPETKTNMSKTSKKADKSKKPKPAESNRLMTGSEIFVEALEREGAEVLFAYPGGASMELHQVLTRSKKIRTILPRHEQGGSFAASGYARATGKAGLCMTTSGPGATNLVTAIADAYMDSVPLISITGQVVQSMIGRGAFQETDVFGMTLPMVKHSYLITDINDIPRIVKEAFYIATSGRPGPVVIDFPKNIQQAKAVPVWPTELDLPGYPPAPKADDETLNKILDLIEKSERPTIYCGGGIITGEASEELRQFAELTGIPVTTTLMGIGAIPSDHPLSLRWLGMHGAAFANWAVNGELKKELLPDGTERIVKLANGADLLLAFACRFDDRVTGKFEAFCQEGTIVHVDIDASEHNKNRMVSLTVESDIKYALSRLIQLLKQRSFKKNYEAWHKQIDLWKKKAPFRYKVTEEIAKSDHVKDHMAGKENEVILPQSVIDLLCEMTKGEALICTGVGQHQMWSGQYYRCKYPRQFISSLGLGSMGFGYPAALGVKVAFPNKQVVDIDGDGSFLMNVQELATAHIEKIGVKAIILNNQHLGMVMQWEDRFYKGNRGHTYLGNPDKRAFIYPDYVTICKGFNVPAERVMFKSDLRGAIERMLAADGPYLLDVITPYTEHVLPFIPANRTVAEMIVED